MGERPQKKTRLRGECMENKKQRLRGLTLSYINNLVSNDMNTREKKTIKGFLKINKITEFDDADVHCDFTQMLHKLFNTLDNE